MEVALLNNPIAAVERVVAAQRMSRYGRRLLMRRARRFGRRQVSLVHC